MHWKVGYEIELLAPVGKNRRDLAEAIATHVGGTVRRCFHLESEPSKVPGMALFRTLTLGFEVVDGQGRSLGRCVDDLTLQADLDKSAPPTPSWYRIVSDDLRLLGLVMRHCDPEQDRERVLGPVADLFGVAVDRGPGGMFRVRDELGAPIAIAAPLPGQRDRPCELVTAPIDGDRGLVLGPLLDTVRELGFGVPKEAALHIHFDGGALCSAPVFARLVQTFDARREELRERFGTNPNCRRLGPWPPELLDMVGTPGFVDLGWDEARARLKKLRLSKFRDFNVSNLVMEPPGKLTFEVRILPVSLEVDQILEWTGVFEGLLRSVVE